MKRKEEQFYQEGFQQGFQQEDEKHRKQIAKRMLAKGFEIDAISDLTDLSPDELKKLRNRFDCIYRISKSFMNRP